jgi:alanine dehydrogenase
VTSTAAARAAFEIGKGARQILLLSEAEVRAHLDLSALLDGLEAGFRALALGQVQSPPRPEVTIPGKGFSLAMSAWQPGAQICVKVVNVFDANLDLGLPNHLAMISLFDPDTGATTCVMDGTYITGVRTAATAALSARLLSRPDSRVATIVGAGVQAREHLRLLPLIRSFDRITICSLDTEHAARLAELSPIATASADLEASIRESDVVCLATHSPSPVIDPTWVRPGTHVTSVGYFPPHGELPRPLLDRGRLFVETLDAFEPAPVGCSDLSGSDPSTATTLGEFVLDASLGRRGSDEITIYKGMGIGMEDMVAANLAYDAARASAPAQTMTW